MILCKYSDTTQIFSPFWKEIVKLGHIGEISVAYDAGTDTKIRFWVDIWFLNCSLASRFPYLFSMCTNQQILLQDVLLSQGENLHFNRELTGILGQDWAELLTIISTTAFTHHIDKISWRWENSGKFSVQSLYKFLNFQGVKNEKYTIWWLLHIPPKIKVFMWLLSRNKILTKNCIFLIKADKIAIPFL